MTHTKLLKMFDDLVAFDDKGHALRAVIKRHHPKVDFNGYSSCAECSSIAYYNIPYPCPTIIDITKEVH